MGSWVLAYGVIDVDVLLYARATSKTLYIRCALSVNIPISTSYTAFGWWALIRAPMEHMQLCAVAMPKTDDEVLHIERIVHSRYLIMRSKFMCVHFTSNSFQVCLLVPGKRLGRRTRERVVLLKPMLKTFLKIFACTMFYSSRLNLLGPFSRHCRHSACVSHALVKIN